MKFIIVSAEKELISVSSSLLGSSVPIRFMHNQFRGKKLEFIIITFYLIKSKSILKLIEFCKHTYFNIKYKNSYDLDCCNNEYELYFKKKQYYNSWNRDFLKINTMSLLEVLVTAHLLVVKELIELVVYGLAIFFIRRLNRKRFSKTGNNENIIKKKYLNVF